MIEDKPHLIEKEVFDLRKYIVSALLLLKIIEIVITIYMMLQQKETDAVQQSLDSNEAYITGVFL